MEAGPSAPRDMAHLPHLCPFDEQPIVFLTVCTFERQPLLAADGCHVILRTLWEESAVRNGWFVGRYVLMPDHVHLFARASKDARTLADWMRIWKSISSRRIQEAGKRRGAPFWQAEYFDRFLRSAESYSLKWDYVANNPVRKGLVRTREEWRFAGEIWELRW